jgi:hypothetical protein
MTRFENWPEVLDAEVKACLTRPFEWGSHDCALMAADIVKAMTGEDLMADMRGKYTNATGARRVIHKLGGLEAAITARLGEPKPLGFAQRGDVVLAELALGPTVGVCMGINSAFPGVEGAQFVATALCDKAWEV